MNCEYVMKYIVTTWNGTNELIYILMQLTYMVNIIIIIGGW